MTGYKPREISKVLVEALENMPVVVLSGMRQTGKSTLLLNQPELRNRRYISFDDFSTLEAAKSNPEDLIGGKEPLTIDEAQKYPEILNVIKQEVDRKRKPGAFLLSGSANFLLLKKVAESLAGRAVYLTLHPFIRREIHDIAKEAPAIVHFLKEGAFPKRKVNPIVCEEHNVIGGLASSVGEVVAENYPKKVIHLGIRNRFGQSGEPEDLLKEYNLTSLDIEKAVLSNIS